MNPINLPTTNAGVGTVGLPPLGGMAIDEARYESREAYIHGTLGLAFLLLVWVAMRPKSTPTEIARARGNFRSQPSCEGSVERMGA